MLIAEGIHTFKHNVQSVRIVELLEKKYHYDGLKITMPVKEGILKHTSLPKCLPDYCNNLFIEKPYSVTLEGQVVAISDEIAQITHDLDDYLRYNILPLSELTNHELFDEVRSFYLAEYNTDIDDNLGAVADDARKKDLLIRCLVDFLVTRLVQHSHSNLSLDLRAFHLDNVYIRFKDPLKGVVENFHDKLNAILFSDFRVTEMDRRGESIIQALVTYFKMFPRKLPPETFLKYAADDENCIVVLADYISGMTDRYALEQYEGLIT
jgi:dGTPase